MSDSIKEVSDEGKAGMLLLQTAFERNMVATIATTRKDGAEVDLLCIISGTEDGGTAISPIAEFIIGNPFERYNPPGGDTTEIIDDAENPIRILTQLMGEKGLTPGNA